MFIFLSKSSNLNCSQFLNVKCCHSVLFPMAAADIFKSLKKKKTPLQDWDPRMGYIIYETQCKMKMSSPLFKTKNSKMVTAQHSAKCSTLCDFPVAFPVWVRKGGVPVGTLVSSSSR